MIPKEKKAPECMVHGCQSLVHVYADYEGGKLRLHGFADALIVNVACWPPGAAPRLGMRSTPAKQFLAVDPSSSKRRASSKTLTPSKVATTEATSTKSSSWKP